MTTLAHSEEIRTLNFSKQAEIKAPIQITFESILEELGPGGEMPDGKPFPMKLEPWPGGRWYRDLGNNTGHFWGTVQVIKPPALLEITGPMFMSYPANSHLQYRLEPIGPDTRLTLTHRALGLIPQEHLEGVKEGWQCAIDTIRKIAKAKLAK
ncbi:MAG: SRPBCC domain-containing protein [Phycisphaerales bacterium]|nr:SRPBCC domain-containing protein [Phycisphaerales bacterium]